MFVLPNMLPLHTTYFQRSLNICSGAQLYLFKTNGRFQTSISSQFKKQTMVTVTGYAERTRKDGSTFIALEITGGVELIQSSTTGRYYATVRKCSIPSTFNAIVAEAMIGQKLPGEVVKVITEPYDFVNPRTGELMKLQHSYAYSQDSKVENAIGHTRVHEVASI